MAITLTNEYQLVSSIPLTYGAYRTYAKYTEQLSSTNRTAFKLIGCYYTTQNHVAFSNATSSIYGNSKGFGYTTVYKGETRLHEVYGTIDHNNDGSSPEITINTSWNASFGGSGSSSGVIKAPKIDRLATLDESSLPTLITDESSIKFSYSNPAGFKVKPVITITQNASNGFEGDYITSNPYTWNWLTTAENKAKVYDIVRNSPNATARLKLNTYDSNGNFIGSTMSSTTIPFTLVNCSPTISLTCTEQNTKVKNIVGNKLILLNNVSSLKVEASVGTKKGASVVEVLVQGKKVESPYSTIFTVSGTAGNYKVNASVKDSRQLITTATSSTYQLVDYRPVSIDFYKFKRENPTSSKIKLNAEITYWNVTLNGTANAPTISYSTDGSNYVTIPSSGYTIDNTNHKITISNFRVADLSYKNQGTYYLKVVDKFTEDKENQIVTKGIAIFERGEHDVQVNGDLFLADESRQNKAPLNVSGKVSKNLFNGITTNAYVDLDGGLISAPDWIASSDYIKIEPNTTYIISANTTATRLLYAQYKNGVNVGGRTEIKPGASFTTSSDVDSVKFSLNDINATNIQLEKGSTATEYEEYYEPTLSIRNSNGVFQEIEIDNKDNYSTAEQVIGTWIDGKPLYRKVISINSLPNNTNRSYSTGLTHGTHSVKNFYGCYTNGQYELGLNEYSGSSYIRTVIASTSNIQISTNSDRSSYSGFVVLEYTKTTD